MKRLLPLIALLTLTGCQQMPRLEGEGISRTMKGPGFSDTISADTAGKATAENGTVRRDVTGYKHDTTILGWGRTLTADKASFDIKPKKTP